MHLGDDRLPVYRQLARRLASALMDGEPPEGVVMPTVKALATQHVLNPATVARALQTLNEAGVLDSRGQELYVKAGAREMLREAERVRFLREEWPALFARLHRLGITREDLAWPPGTE